MAGGQQMIDCIIQKKAASKRASARLALGLILTLFLTATSSHAATLSSNIVDLGTGNYNISVYPKAASYKSLAYTTTGPFGDGDVLDYRFINCVSGAVNYAGYTVGVGDRILAPTNANSYSYSTFDYAKVWTTNSPGTDFSSQPDFSIGTEMQGTDIRGEVNIKGMIDGTLYVIGGKIPNYTAADRTVSLVMSGAGQPDMTVSATTNAPPGHAYIWEFPFADVQLYEKIEYHCQMESYSRGRFMGLILDGTLIPKGTVITIN
jgi:hypothetical protein